MLRLTLCALLLLAASVASTHRPVRTYTLDLDQAPQHRYDHIVKDTANGFNTTVWSFYNKYFANDKILTDVLYGISAIRGKENTEMEGEIAGLAAISGLPVKFVRSIQMLYELQTLMVPIVNFTHAQGGSHTAVDVMPPGYEALERIPWRGPGCTGIIARNKEDGTVYHARNLDFSPVPVMTSLVFNGVFTRGGKEVFRTQMIMGYTMAITGVRMGKNGFAIERNTRYTSHKGGNSQMMGNLLKGRELNGWQLRKVLEEQTDFEAAITQLSTLPYASTEYAIVSGVQKGVILSRDPDRVVHTQTLGEVNPGIQGGEDYIIITNFDFFWHDIREFFDPTGGGGFGKPSRRVAAQTILNASASLTPAVLFKTINAEHVIADTVFQAIINVEKGIWNISQPDL